ncbi:hypothetical protein P691DRAFT_717100 [Macrolepiota fuliginosa MF-IS2]|uniref:LigT-like protein n=1 Tax=Macrolepiota fuliginosa MF-IS2 TaxID=1400762 RepID=A0A9P5XNE8_9AGAR|nr:hypothetical protein P691DRAFT_717100 [Macrolepiota fuliginosa MF-IS2]
MAIRKGKLHLPTTYPAFEPHITLASVQSDTPIPLSTIRESISATQRVFQANFKSVDVGDHYFRSVYVAVHPDETLVNLHRTVHEKLGVDPRTPKYPHMSLVYVSDEDAASGERERYYEELKERTLMQTKSQESEEGVELRTSADKEWIGGFGVAEIWVMECIGPVEAWVVLDKIRLLSD